MQYANVGKYIMLGSFILTLVTVIETQALGQVWTGLLAIAFFLFAVGLALTSYGEAMKKQDKSNRALGVCLSNTLGPATEV